MLLKLHTIKSTAKLHYNMYSFHKVYYSVRKFNGLELECTFSKWHLLHFLRGQDIHLDSLLVDRMKEEVVTAVNGLPCVAVLWLFVFVS